MGEKAGGTIAQKKIKHYQRLEKANGHALQALSDFQRAVQEGRPDFALDRYMALASGVYKMAANYRELGQGDNYWNFCQMFHAVEQRTGETLEEQLGRMAFGEAAEIDLEVDYINLNWDERQGGYHNFSACRTWHDFIRILHASGLEALFTCSELEKAFETKSYEGTRDSFRILDLSDGMNNELLEAIQVMNLKKISKIGREEAWNIISQPGKISSRVIMGCHYSYLDISVKNGSARVDVRFVNTHASEFDYAPYRGEYVKGVMERMGYVDVETPRNFVIGTKELSDKDILSFVEETVRMFASTKNLDNNATRFPEEGAVDKAVRAFTQGTTRILTFVQENGGTGMQTEEWDDEDDEDEEENDENEVGTGGWEGKPLMKYKPAGKSGKKVQEKPKEAKEAVTTSS
jgi:hypothetical protein